MVLVGAPHTPTKTRHIRVWQSEETYSESQEQARLADTRVADEKQLEEEIAKKEKRDVVSF